MPGRPMDAYKMGWGLTEQPTTINTGANGTYVGNRITFNSPGRVVGMRLGRHKNISDGGAIGMFWTPIAPRIPLRTCQWKPRVASGGTTVVWDNAYTGWWYRVAAAQTLMFVVATLASAIHYNDAQLLAAPYTSANGYFTWPQDANPNRNGATSTAVTIFPLTTANGRRYSVDVLFLPD